MPTPASTLAPAAQPAFASALPIGSAPVPSTSAVQLNPVLPLPVSFIFFPPV